MNFALETIALTKRFRGASRPAVDDLAMRVPQGAIYGFLGANGAGKTTSLRLALGLLRPDRGEIRLFGAPRQRAGGAMIGALIETPSLYPHLTGAENLDITRRLLGLGAGEIGRVLRVVDLSGAGGQRVATYSLGMRQRLAIARALLGRPPLLILDEPTNGLDPAGIADMRALLRRLASADGVTLIVSSHQLSEIEQVASHVGLMHRGRLLVEGEVGALLGNCGLIEVGTADPRASAHVLGKSGFSVAHDLTSGLLLVEAAAQPAAAERIAGLLVGEGQGLSHLAVRRPNLETLYHEAVAQAA